MDNKIAKLDKKNELLGERCNQLLKDKGALLDRIKELETEIEKMKRCSNCTNGKGGCKYRTIFTTVCDKWELRND